MRMNVRMKWIRIMAGIALFLLPLVSKAETLVLVPGFLAQGMDWRFRHVTNALQSAGWVDGGNYTLTAQGILNTLLLAKRPANVFYTLDLPTQSSITYQAEILGQYLQHIHAQRREPLALAGHSAGGVVARYWLVTSPHVPVHTLITIASPHLGTPWAELTEAFINSPLQDMVTRMGIPIANARDLYTELREERPNTFLYWLNHQRHPAIRYVSIVRNNQRPDKTDFVVPPYSQDMDKIAALHGHTETWSDDGDHFLEAQDGYRLAKILASQQRASR